MVLVVGKKGRSSPKSNKKGQGAAVAAAAAAVVVNGSVEEVGINEDFVWMGEPFNGQSRIEGRPYTRIQAHSLLISQMRNGAGGNGGGGGGGERSFYVFDSAAQDDEEEDQIDREFRELQGGVSQLKARAMTMNREATRHTGVIKSQLRQTDDITGTVQDNTRRLQTTKRRGCMEAFEGLRRWWTSGTWQWWMFGV